MPVCGHVRAERGGHEMHQRLVAAILATPDAWSVGEVGRRSYGELVRWPRLARAR
jgi:UDP-3-O-acyl-N-acetylglucosamine deacetylase